MLCIRQYAVSLPQVTSGEESVDAVIEPIPTGDGMCPIGQLTELFGNVAQVHNVGLMVFLRQAIGRLQREVIARTAKDDIILCYVDGRFDVCLKMPFACTEQFVGYVAQVVVGGIICRLVPFAKRHSERLHTLFAITENRASISLVAEIAAKADHSWCISRRGNAVGEYQDAF